MEKNIGLNEKVNLNVTIKWGDETSITGKAHVPLEEVVEGIASANHVRSLHDTYRGRIRYALKKIAEGAIHVFKQGYFKDECHEEQKVYQKFVDYLENKIKNDETKPDTFFDDRY